MRGAFVLGGFVGGLLRPIRRHRRRGDQTLASLDALLDHAPIGVGFLDRDLRFLRVNEALARIADRPVEVHLGRTMDEVIGRPELSAIAREVLATGRPRLDVRVTGTSQTGRPFEVLAGYYPVPGPDGRIEGLGVVVRDVTSSALAERQRDAVLEQLTRLQRLTGQLATARTTSDVTGVVLDGVRRAAGAEAASLCAVDGEDIVVVGGVGYDQDALAAYARLDAESPTPIGDAVRTGAPVLGGRRDDVVRRWPAIVPTLSPGREAVLALPLVADGAVRGAIGLGYDRALDEGDVDLPFLMAVASQCAQAMLRAGLNESEAAARDRLAFLTDASDALTASLDWAPTLRRICELAVPRLADMACAFAVQGEELVTVELVHRDPARAEALHELSRRWPARLDQPSGLGAVLRAGEPRLIERPAPEDRGPVLRLADAGFASLLAVPLRARDRLLGALVLGTEGNRRLGPEDLALASELAARAGQAVVSAELFRERSRIAETLQASLLPPLTPQVPGLELATRFFAVGDGVDVGGDFFDVFRMGTLAAPDDRWAIVIGDVRGKGTEAAAISGTARHAIRATALHERSPGLILDRLNELLLATGAEQDEPWFCTAAVAVVERSELGARAVVAVGGHPPPFVLRATGEVEALPQTGALLGVLPSADVEDLDVELNAGDALVLYTDGVTERHAHDRFFDEDSLASVLARCAGFTAAALAERIETASRAFLEDAPRDDLAIVVLRVPDALATRSATSADLPDDVHAPALARRFVAAALDVVGAPELTDLAMLLASELVTNAVLHGAAPLRISLGALDGTLRVVVWDGAPQLPVLRPPSEVADGGRGIALVDALAARWGVDQAGTGKAVWFELER